MPRMEHEMKKRLASFRKPAAGILAVAVIAGVGFYGGVTFQKHHGANTNNVSDTQTASSKEFGRSGGGFGGGFGGSRAGRVEGQVTAISSTSITIASQSGSSTTLAITSSTTISDNGQSASASDIAVRDTVFVTEDSSNTAQAARIMVNPDFGSQSQSSQSQGNASTQSD